MQVSYWRRPHGKCEHKCEQSLTVDQRRGMAIKCTRISVLQPYEPELNWQAELAVSHTLDQWMQPSWHTHFGLEKPYTNTHLSLPRVLTYRSCKIEKQQGLPWWSSGKNLPVNAGDTSSIPGLGTKMPHAMGQISPHTTTTEALLTLELCSKTREATAMRNLHTAKRESPCTRTKTAQTVQPKMDR